MGELLALVVAVMVLFTLLLIMPKRLSDHQLLAFLGDNAYTADAILAEFVWFHDVDDQLQRLIDEGKVVMTYKNGKWWYSRV